VSEKKEIWICTISLLTKFERGDLGKGLIVKSAFYPTISFLSNFANAPNMENIIFPATVVMSILILSPVKTLKPMLLWFKSSIVVIRCFSVNTRTLDHLSAKKYSYVIVACVANYFTPLRVIPS